MKPLDPEIRNQQREREVLPLFAQQTSLIGQPEPELLALRDVEPPFVTDCEGDADSRASKLIQSNVRPVGGQGDQQAHNFLASTRSSQVPCAGEGEAVSAHPRCLPALSADVAHMPDSGASRPSAGKEQSVCNREVGGLAAHSSAERAHARATDPQTSHKAAASVVNLGRTREMILNILADKGPCTDEQIWGFYSLWFDMRKLSRQASPSGLRSRRSELVALGFVEACGEGKTASGRACTIWRLCK